jgi:hypothetical protein
MAASGVMKVAKAAGDAEDKKLGIKRGPGNTVLNKGIAQDPSKTINGQLNTISERIDGVMGQVGLAIQPFISQLLNGLVSLTGLIPNVLSALQPLFDVINSIPISQIFTELGVSIQTVLQALQPVFVALQPLLSTIFSVLGAMVTQVSQLIAKIMVHLGPALTKVAEVLSAVLGPALEIAGDLFKKLLDVVGWVVDKVSSFIGAISDLFSTADEGMQQVAETAEDKVKAKNAVIALSKNAKPQEVAAAVNMMVQGKDPHTRAAVMSEVKKFALQQDKENHTTKNVDLYNATQKVFDQQDAANKRRQLVPHRPPSIEAHGGGGGSAVQAQGDAITDGGKKSTVINIGKFFDNMNLNAQTMQQGFDDFERRVENIFLRIVSSAG